MQQFKHQSNLEKVIGISTHRTGVEFLRNLLQSFKGHSDYPILVVISDFVDADLPIFQRVLSEFDSLPLYLEQVHENQGEFSVLTAVGALPHFEEVFLLSHSCEIKDTRLFAMAFEDYSGRSLALSFLPHYRQYNAWTSFLGKYRRETLQEIEFARYAPADVFEFHLAEVCLTHTYGSADPQLKVLFPDFVDSPHIFEKLGKRVMKIENPFLIKWKSHWNFDMLLGSMEKQGASMPTVRTVQDYFDKIPKPERFEFLQQLMSSFLHRRGFVE